MEEELKVVDGIKYNENGIPILELPPPIPVKPPKYTYEQYEDEFLSWKKGRKSVSSWREEQRKRWVDGHAGLSGIHYFYLTQIRIKHKGQLIRPLFRDVDELCFNEFLNCVKNEKDKYVFKRRGFGLSTIYAGVIIIYIMVTQPGSTCLMTSADLGRVKDLLVNKFFSQIDSLEEWIGLKRTKNDDSKGIYESSHYDEDGNVEKGIKSVLLCAQTSQDKKDVGKFEGARAAYAFLDELFLHPYPIEVRAQTLPCLMDDFSRWGIMVSGGSAGLGNKLGMDYAKNIWKNAEHDHSYTPLFIPGYLGISSVTIRDSKGDKVGSENFCINGWSDEKRAEAYIKWQRATHDMNPDKKNYMSFVKQYPLTIDEVFKSDVIGVIPEDIAMAIPTQELELERRPRNIRRIRVELDPNGHPTFTNDPLGAWMIVEEPVAGRTYEMGTDMAKMLMTKEESTMDPNGTDRSMNACVIKCIETDSYVAVYLRRTSDEKLIYREISIAQKLYNNCENMVERNTADVLYLQYKYDNNLHALAYQPRWIGSKDWKKNKTRGVWKGSNEDKLLSAMFGYFRVYMHNVDFPIILEQLKVFGLENCDVIDAMVMCEVLSKGREVTDGQRALEAMKVRYREVPMVTMKDGKRHTEYIKVQIGENEQNKPVGGMIWKPAQ